MHCDFVTSNIAVASQQNRLQFTIYMTSCLLSLENFVYKQITAIRSTMQKADRHNAHNTKKPTDVGPTTSIVKQLTD